ncbi:invasion associated locus B family protein [Pseudovibrio sp. POLY-S9]|uniref:invasion associated locus B family protein n=1 Tax=Pseudovibrio sp. POLY-S9 TaxID=1576596 RepID=UPI00128F8BF8|nr:invasion associated locus B family protein [Pseudovibrio sp. POLY-S9]
MLLCTSATAKEVTTEPAGPQSDWQILCEAVTETAGNGQNCRMSQTLMDGEQKRSLLVARVFAGKQPSLLVQAPLQVFLKAGVVVQVDKGKSYAFAYEFCNLDGCYAGIPLPKSLLNSFKRGKTAIFSIRDIQGNQASFDISLKGFTKTFKELRSKN